MPLVLKWATCYTNKQLNFGQRTTSPVEAINRYLKSFVLTGNSAIKEVIDQCFNMADLMKERIIEGERCRKQCLRYDYPGKDWLGDAP